MPPLAVIIAWPVISVFLFSRLTAAMALTATIVLGFLLLPHGTTLDLPVLAPIDKLTMPAVSALVFCYALTRPEHMRQALPTLWPKQRLMQVLLIVVPLSALLMVLTNSDRLVYGPRVIPGLRIYDAMAVIQNLLILLTPLVLARKFLCTAELHIALLRFLVFAGLGYSLLAIIEVIMSPQLNLWLYGYFPHSWAQHYRYGGWRPIVFMQHGLVLSLFFSLCTIAALCLVKIDKENRTFMIAATGWLFMTLILSKSLGALMIGILIMSVALLLRPRGQVIVAATICGFFLLYPIMRASDTFPIETILAQFERISPERAQSLEVRFYHEGQKLAKANERPVFGWGVWGRSRVFDPKTGDDLTIADGYWVINIGVGGWVRYLSTMGLLTFPVFLLLRRRNRDRLDQASAALALMIAANIIDLIPNSGLTPVTMLLAGALWGRLDPFAKVTTTQEGPPIDASSPISNYTRQTERIERVPQGTSLLTSAGESADKGEGACARIATGVQRNRSQTLEIDRTTGKTRPGTMHARPHETKQKTRNPKR